MAAPARRRAPAQAAIFKYSSSAATMACFLASLAARDRRRAKGTPALVPWPSATGWRYVLASATLNVFLEMCYTLGFAFTTSANVLAFAAIAPVWAALMSWPALGLRVPRRTVVACAFALAGSVVIGLSFRATLGTSATGADEGARTRDALGLVFAIGTGITAAAQLTLIQSAAMRAPETNMLIAHGLGVALVSLTGFALLPALHPPGAPLAPTDAAIGYLCLDGVVGSAFAISALTLAVSFIPATEVSLLLQVEGLLGPLSTFLVLNEVPTVYSLAGGGVVIAAVVVHEALAFREEIRAARDEAAASAAALSHSPAADAGAAELGVRR